MTAEQQAARIETLANAIGMLKARVEELERKVVELKNKPPHLARLETR